jgi:hypothetical protein
VAFSGPGLSDVFWCNLLQKELGTSQGVVNSKALYGSYTRNDLGHPLALIFESFLPCQFLS